MSATFNRGQANGPCSGRLVRALSRDKVAGYGDDCLITRRPGDGTMVRAITRRGRPDWIGRRRWRCDPHGLPIRSGAGADISQRDFWQEVLASRANATCNHGGAQANLRRRIAEGTMGKVAHREPATSGDRSDGAPIWSAAHDGREPKQHLDDRKGPNFAIAAP